MAGVVVQLSSQVFGLKPSSASLDSDTQSANSLANSNHYHSRIRHIDIKYRLLNW
jgi:hypothetical protein